MITELPGVGRKTVCHGEEGAKQRAGCGGEIFITTGHLST